MKVWNDEQDKILRDLWDQGLSAREISYEMPGKSRNSILGRARRIKLSDRVPTKANPTARRASRLPVIRNAVPFVSVVPVMADRKPTKQLFDLTYNECRFAFGENAPFLFCANPTEDGSSYCPACMAIVYQPRRVA